MTGARGLPRRSVGRGGAKAGAPAKKVALVRALSKLGYSSRSQAYELAKRGELPGAIKLGGRIVVSRRVLDRVLDGESEPREGAP